MSTAAIPTTYKGLRFRSRLEAQWAAMFDRLLWRWEYEPIDLEGYIPDFIVQFNVPLLVEVKPCLCLDTFGEYQPKIENAGWAGEAMIVGAVLHPPEFDLPFQNYGLRVGRFFQTEHHFTSRGWYEAELVVCHMCKHVTPLPVDGNWWCRQCGRWSDKRSLFYKSNVRIHDMWTTAKNETQWMRR